jgi:hypothetical protein
MSQKPRLLHQVLETLRIKHCTLRTEQAYVNWIKRFILYHDKCLLREMRVTEVRAFLAYMAVEEQISTSNQQYIICNLFNAALPSSLLSR